MAEGQQNPVLTFLKDKAMIIAVAAIVIVAAVYIGITRTGGTEEATGPEPTAAPTAVLGGGAESPTATPTDSGSPSPSEGAQAGAGDLPTDAATPAKGTELEIHVGNAQQAVEAADWREVADGFSAAWANPEGGKDAWLKRLRPYVTDSLYRSFSYTDINQVPSDEYQSASPLEEGGPTMSFQAFFVDGGNRFNGLLEIQNDGSWLVKTIGSGG